MTTTATVTLPAARAFEIFTGSMSTWWPHRYHVGAADVADVVLEPGIDGSECGRGRVPVWPQS